VNDKYLYCSKIILCMNSITQLEKHIWICAFMAVGSKYKCTVGEVEVNHNEEVRAVITELTKSAASVSPLFHLCECSYFLSLIIFCCSAVK